MNNTQSPQLSLITLKRHAFCAMFICYLPHFATAPAWVSVVFLAAIGYRMIADYHNYPLIPRWLRFALVLGFLVLLSGNIHTNRFLISFLLIFISLKCIEIQTLRDIKVLVLCNFYLIFSALIVFQELWIIGYLLIAIPANLSILLKLSASQISLRHICARSCIQVLLAIPLSILLFYMFPRINPLWHIPSMPLAQTRAGFNDRMSPGSLENLFKDDSIAMQIVFKSSPILKGYWRGIILNFYTGDTWNSTWYPYSNFSPLPEFKSGDAADYEIILEPNQKKWLFYDGYPLTGGPNLLFSPDHGLLRQNKESITQRFAYAIKVQPAPYHDLTAQEFAEATQLPYQLNPRLNAWAKAQFAREHYNVRAFIQFLHDYIHQQDFWYTLSPPRLNTGVNQMDKFWFDTQKGFCEHYASAVTYILRAAGIPARVVLGYQGGQWNPIAHAISLRQSDAHAWLEFWQKDIGWQELDPTSFIAFERIDKSILSHQTYILNSQDFLSVTEMYWWQKIPLYYDSARFLAEQWFLFYNQNTQQDLLSRMGLGKVSLGQLAQATIGCMIVFFLFLGLCYRWWQRQTIDALLLEYHLLQKEFQRFNISTLPPATLTQQCKELIHKVPGLTPVLSAFFYRYEELRLKRGERDTKENQRETIALFRKLRGVLRRRRV